MDDFEFGARLGQNLSQELFYMPSAKQVLEQHVEVDDVEERAIIHAKQNPECVIVSIVYEDYVNYYAITDIDEFYRGLVSEISEIQLKQYLPYGDLIYMDGNINFVQNEVVDRDVVFVIENYKFAKLDGTSDGATVTILDY